MKRVFAALLCGLMGILATGVAIARRMSGQTEMSTERLVTALRTLNTAEYSYRGKAGRFAHREEMLTFLREKGTLSRAPIDLENPKPYELVITTSQDGAHYQITLKPDMSEKSLWCKTAAFTDDRGVIFLGSALDCESSSK